jgi:hypothetical protein
MQVRVAGLARMRMGNIKDKKRGLGHLMNGIGRRGRGEEKQTMDLKLGKKGYERNQFMRLIFGRS